MITVELCFGLDRKNIKRFPLHCVPQVGDDLVFLDSDYRDHHYTVMSIQHMVGPESKTERDVGHIIFVDLIESPAQDRPM